METTSPSKRNARKQDVQQIITNKMLEQLKKGIVPWRVSWVKAGVPENLISRNAYRGINLVLLAGLGYERNLFLTSNQLKDMEGGIRATEKPHVISWWDADTEAVPEAQKPDKKQGVFSTYTVFNISQCLWKTEPELPGVAVPLHPVDECEAIFRDAPDLAAVKSKNQNKSYYDPLTDYINLPHEDKFPSKEAHYEMFFHLLMHSTGYHGRLNRKDLIQMSEFGYDAFSHEELVAEIGASYLLSYVGMELPFTPTQEYLQGWIQKLEADKYFLFSACNQAQKAIDYILNADQKEV